MINAAALAILRRPKEALIIALLMVVAWLGWRLKTERSRPQELAAKSEGLPPDTSQVVQVGHNHVIERWRDGPTKIQYRDRYLPSEGKLEVVTEVNPPHGKIPEIRIRDYGFTFRLGGGTIYSGHFLPQADVKIAYWGRYSALVGFTPEFGAFGASRHVDDFLPFQNLEIAIFGGLSWRGNNRIGLSIRSNF